MTDTYETLGINLETLSSMGQMDYDNYDPADLPALSPEEDKLWYSKFYYKGREELAPELAAKVAPGNSMNPENAIIPGKNIDLLTGPGHIESDFGYCLLPGGGGYGAGYCELPEITMEMYKWYRDFRMASSNRLSYAIWYPGSHYSEFDGKTLEDVGLGLEHFEMAELLNSEKLGFTQKPAQVDPMYAGMIANSSWIKNHDYPELTPRAITLVHYIKNMKCGGIEFITHIYMGMHCINKKMVPVQNIDPKLLLELTRKMIHHCVYERANLNSFLPELYEKMKDEPFVLDKSINAFPISE